MMTIEQAREIMAVARQIRDGERTDDDALRAVDRRLATLIEDQIDDDTDEETRAAVVLDLALSSYALESLDGEPDASYDRRLAAMEDEPGEVARAITIACAPCTPDDVSAWLRARRAHGRRQVGI